ncbi:hypothetical protein B1T32_05405 [Staphylococcus aureus]|nr:hypothetical protein B1T32_05405 [Staphylococcus aureus]
MDSIACSSIIDLLSNIFFTIGVNFNFDVNSSLMYSAGLVNFHLYFGLIIIKTLIIPFFKNECGNLFIYILLNLNKVKSGM